MKRKWLAIGIILLFVGTCIIPATAQNTEKQSSRGNWLYVGGSGLGNYSKIQDAIDNAQPGDTVFVYDDSSPYLESLRIRKSIHLIGENKTTTIINSSHQDTIGSFDYDNILIKNFTLLNCMNYTDTYGVDLSFAKNVTLTNTIIIGCHWGIQLEDCDNCSITNNEIREGYTGIKLYNVDTSTLSGNQIKDNIYGIELNYASTNTISNNELINNGMYLVNLAYPNSIVGNTVNGKTLLYLENENDILIENESAGQIILIGCNRITMQNLNLSHATVGVMLINTNNCLLTKTILRFNTFGVMVLDSNRNVLSYNYIDNNSYGITFEPYSYNTQNSVIENSIQSNMGMGIVLSGLLNKVKNNLIKNNSLGIFIQNGVLNLIQSNNIIKNKINAMFQESVGTVFFRNYWEPNFGLRPKIIPGIQFGVIGFGYNGIPIFFPWLKIDWFAARLPYDIPGLR